MNHVSVSAVIRTVSFQILLAPAERLHGSMQHPSLFYLSLITTLVRYLRAFEIRAMHFDARQEYLQVSGTSVLMNDPKVS
jgi:hypothetical protein